MLKEKVHNEFKKYNLAKCRELTPALRVTRTGKRQPVSISGPRGWQMSE